jgi:hypothetical protein
MSDEQGTPPCAPWGVWVMKSPITEHNVPILLFLDEENDGEYRLIDMFASEWDRRENAYWQWRGTLDAAELRRLIEQETLIRVGDMPRALITYA